MSLPPLSQYSYMSPIENKRFNTRVMFTEIDYNYTGKPGKAYKSAIDTVFNNRSEWINGAIEWIEAYSTSKYIFDAYMTYAVYLLYCKEKYAPADFQKACKATEQVMKKRFPQMKAFTDKILALRAQRPDQKIEDLYPDFLKLF